MVSISCLKLFVKLLDCTTLALVIGFVLQSEDEAMALEGIIEETLQKRWDAMIDAIRGYNPNKIEFIYAVNDFLHTVDSHAKIKDKEISNDYIFDCAFQCHEANPRSLWSWELSRLKRIGKGLIGSISSPQKDELKELFLNTIEPESTEERIASLYKFLCDTINVTCSAIHEDEFEVIHQERDLQVDIINICQQPADEFENLLSFNNERIFINLCLKIMRVLCEYVINYPEQTLSHSGQAEAAFLLKFTNELMLQHRDWSGVKRTVMILSHIQSLSKNNSDLAPIILDSIQKKFFPESNCITDPVHLNNFKLNPAYYEAREAYIQNIQIKNNHIALQRNRIPFAAIKTHLIDKPEHTSYFAKIINWFFTIINRNKFQNSLKECQFLVEKKFCKGDEPLEVPKISAAAA